MVGLAVRREAGKPLAVAWRKRHCRFKVVGGALKEETLFIDERNQFIGHARNDVGRRFADCLLHEQACFFAHARRLIALKQYLALLGFYFFKLRLQFGIGLKGCL